MSDHLTEERLDAITDVARAVTEAPLFESNGYTYTNEIRDACQKFSEVMSGDYRHWRVRVDRPVAILITQLITALQRERAAHQATKAELDAGRKLRDAQRRLRDHICPLCQCVPRLDCGERYLLLVALEQAEAAYDAARAGQEELP